QAGADRPLRTAEVPAGFLRGLALQVAEDNGGAVLLRQAVDLLIQDRPKVQSGLTTGPGGGEGQAAPRPRALPGRAGANAQGDAVGHLVEPAPQGFPSADGAGPPGQRQESRLEGVLDVLGATEQAAGEADDEAAVAPDQRLERRLVAAGDE